MIRTLAVAPALAGAILLAPVAQAQPGNIIGPIHSNLDTSGVAVARGPLLASKPNKFKPTITATPFGAPGTFADQPGLAEAMENGTMRVPTGMPFGYRLPMARGNPVGPTTITAPLGGGIRTRHGRTGGTSSPGL